MKVRVHSFPIGADGLSAAPYDLEADMILYGCDGDGELYYEMRRADGTRCGGGQFARGGYLHVEEVEVADSSLTGKWRKLQNEFRADPDLIPN